MLRLLPKPGAGQDPPKQRPKWKRADVLRLTDDEIRHLRAGLHNLRFALGGWKVVAMVTGIPQKTIESASMSCGERPSGTFALRVAKAAGLPVETLLSGELRVTDRCPTCGTHAADRRKGAT